MLERFFDGNEKGSCQLLPEGGMLRGRLRKSKLQVDLPKLVVSEPDKETSPLIAGDWLTLAGPAMRDLRPTVRNGGRK